jgi:hypothetical protein
VAVEGSGTVFVAVHDVFPAKGGTAAEAKSEELAGSDGRAAARKKK